MGLAIGFFIWFCLCIIITGAEDADRASYENMMAKYDKKIAEAKTKREREIAQDSKSLFMGSRPPPPKKWY